MNSKTKVLRCGAAHRHWRYAWKYHSCKKAEDDLTFLVYARDMRFGANQQADDLSVQVDAGTDSPGAIVPLLDGEPVRWPVELEQLPPGRYRVGNRGEVFTG